MAVLQSSNHVLPYIRIRRASGVRRSTRVRRGTIVPSPSPSLAHQIGHLAQVLLGISFLLLGIAFVLTLVLLPIGLPLALVGIALIAAPSDS
jgi:hypothetical protein